MVKTLRSLLIMLTVALTLCFSFVALSVFAGEEPESLPPEKNLTAQTEYSVTISNDDLKISGVGLGSSSNYSTNKNAYYTFIMRNKSCVIKFAEPVDANYYGVITIGISKNISSQTTFAFYKNQSGETSAIDTVKCTTLDKEEKFAFALKDYANSEGMVDSIVMQHLSDQSNYDNPDFQAFLYSIKLSTVSDYVLNVTSGDVDMDDGNISITGATGRNFIVHTGTGKLFCNEFHTGCATKLKFETSINTRFYKTLGLNVFLSGITSSKFTFYFSFYKSSATNVAQVNPVFKASIQNNTDTVLEIDLEKFADDGGMVDSIIIYHYANTRAKDFENLSLWVYASDVLTREPEPVKVKWPIQVSSVNYANNYDGANNNILVATLENNVFATSTQTDIVDADKLNEIAKNIRINNVRLYDSGDLVKCIQSYDGQKNKIAFVFSTAISGDGSDRISLGSNLPITVEDTTYLFKEDYEYSIVYTEDGLENNVRDFGVINNVTAEYTADYTKLNIFFDKTIGSITGTGIKTSEKLIVNGVKVSQNPNMSIAVSENILTITVLNSAEILNNDGKDTLTIEEGFVSSNFYIEKSVTYDQYAINSTNWFLDTDSTLDVFFVQNLVKNNGEEESDKYAEFEIKFSKEFKGEEFRSEKMPQFDKIIFNGESLSQIYAEEVENKTYRVRITISGDLVKIRVPLLKFNGNDEIIVKKGFTLPQGGEVGADVKFKYDELYEQFSTVADRSLFPYVGVTVTLVESDTMNSSLTSLFLKFGEVVSEGYIILGLHESELSAELAKNPAMDLKDAHIAQFAKYGVIESTLDYIVIDGLSVRQILLNDKAHFGGFKNTVKVNYHGTGFNRGYVMSISLSDGSLGILDPNTTHKITLKKGFVTAGLMQITEDISYYYNTVTGKWQARPFAENSDVTSGKGCSGSLSVNGIFTGLILLGTAMVVTIKKFRRKAR